MLALRSRQYSNKRMSRQSVSSTSEFTGPEKYRGQTGPVYSDSLFQEKICRHFSVNVANHTHACLIRTEGCHANAPPLVTHITDIKKKKSQEETRQHAHYPYS